MYVCAIVLVTSFFDRLMVINVLGTYRYLHITSVSGVKGSSQVLITSKNVENSSEPAPGGVVIIRSINNKSRRHKLPIQHDDFCRLCLLSIARYVLVYRDRFLFLLNDANLPQH